MRRITWQMTADEPQAGTPQAALQLQKVVRLLYLCSLVSLRIGFNNAVRAAGRRLLTESAQGAKLVVPYNEPFFSARLDTTLDRPLPGAEFTAHAPVFVLTDATHKIPLEYWTPGVVTLGNHAWVLDAKEFGITRELAGVAAPLISHLGRWAMSANGVLLYDSNFWQPEAYPAMPNVLDGHNRPIDLSVHRWYARMLKPEGNKEGKQ